MTNNEIRQKANKLRQEKKYQEALPLFEQLWNADNENKWDGWGYALCLKQTKNFEKAIEVCKKVLEIDNNFNYIINIYTWSLYEALSDNDKSIPKEEFIAKAYEILNYTTDEDLIYSKIIFKVINKLKESPNYSANEILTWLEKLNPEHLSKKSFKFNKGNKHIDIASEYEQYFMNKTKALFEKNEFSECIKYCNIALKSIDKFHYNNNIWFKWRIALSHKELGELENALKILIEINNIKNEWFIQKEISEIYFKTGNFDKALHYALKAIMNFGDTDKKIHLIILLAEIFNAKNMDTEAELAFSLANSIIIENDWKIKFPEILSSKFGKNHEYTSSNEIFNKLKKLSEKIYYESKEKISGTISTILPNGKAGFINTNNKKSYYFSIKDLKGKKEEFKKGTPVIFYLEDSYDFKKKKQVKNAVRIEMSV